MSTVDVPRARTLHSKRSFGKYPKLVDSPAYDASEEDNDPLTDDGASAVSLPTHPSRPQNSTTSSSNTSNTMSRLHPKSNTTSRPMKHHLASALLSDSDGVDSPTYDGDVESSATAGADNNSSKIHHGHHHNSSSVSTLNTPLLPLVPLSPSNTPISEQSNPATRGSNPNSSSSAHHVFISPHIPTNVTTPLLATEEPAVAAASEAAFNPAALTPEDIQAFVQKAIDGEVWRKYKINPPPVGRPVRVYADGVYDLFHFGHALQLRQAKLSFPSVYLLVGVNSDEQVRKHKARNVMTHAERLEAARHCRWVDEVVAEAPWVLDEAFIKKYEIDYVAHDEDPYASLGHEDVYCYIKSQGKFIPTRRTPGVSTSELLERIVSGYRKRDFDDKLTKMGHAELRAEGSDYDEWSVPGSRRDSRRQSRVGSPLLGTNDEKLSHVKNAIGGKSSSVLDMDVSMR